MVGTRSPGHGTGADSVGAGGGGAKEHDAPGKRTLTTGLDAAAGPDAAPEIGLAAIAQMGPGRPLDAAAATAAGKALGQPPGEVTVHIGPEAERFAAQHQARAVTVG